jgi:hypothetical protein
MNNISTTLLCIADRTPVRSGASRRRRPSPTCWRRRTLTTTCASSTRRSRRPSSRPAQPHSPPVNTEQLFPLMVSMYHVSYTLLSTSVFLIRFHLIRILIWIQHFVLNADPNPDPIRIQGFELLMIKNLKKNYS